MSRSDTTLRAMLEERAIEAEGVIAAAGRVQEDPEEAARAARELLEDHWMPGVRVHVQGAAPAIDVSISLGEHQLRATVASAGAILDLAASFPDWYLRRSFAGKPRS